MTSRLSAQGYNLLMKGLAAAALAIAIALPVCAQRGGGGGGHAGFSGHGASGAPAFHGGFAPSHGTFAPSAPMRYSGSSLVRPPVPYPSSVRLTPGVRYPGTVPLNRPNFYHPGHPGTITHNHFFVRTYPGYPYNPYAYPSYVYGYLPNDIFDDDYGDYDSSQLQPEAQPDYGSAYPQQQPDSGYPQPDGSYAYPQPDGSYAYPQPAPAYPGYPQPQPAPDGAYAYPVVPPGYQPYAPQPMPVQPQMQYVPGSATTVILIYKDGRPPEQIQNYLATRSTLTILDGGRRREVPLAELNIPATISANRQTGVDFQLPSATR
jgi:hypothetical protein